MWIRIPVPVHHKADPDPGSKKSATSLFQKREGENLLHLFPEEGNFFVFISNFVCLSTSVLWRSCYDFKIFVLSVYRCRSTGAIGTRWAPPRVAATATAATPRPGSSSPTVPPTSLALRYSRRVELVDYIQLWVQFLGFNLHLYKKVWTCSTVVSR